jgi:DNA-binding response OmpR family regulator
MSGNANCDVLIVEDDRIQCEEMADFLGRSGLAIETAYNGATAIEAATATQPRVALLDFNLPDTTGLQVAEQIRALWPETAILMMSGRIDGLPEQTLQSLGIKVFVNKPLPLGPLRQAVLRLVKAAPVNQVQTHRNNGWMAAGVGGTRH